MESLPIPKLRSSWVAALILTLIIFLLYYLFAFNYLLNLYRSQFESIFFEQNQSDIKVIAFVPKYYNPSELTWAHLNIHNNSNNPIYDLEVYLVAQSDENTLLLPNLYGDNVYSSGNTFTVIEPHSVATARIPFITQGDAAINKVILIQKNDYAREELERQSPLEYVQPNRSAWKTIQHSFLETILLPPWSNTFILALVLFSTYLVRNRSEEELNTPEPDEPRTFTYQWWYWVKQDINNSTNVLVWMIFLTVLFVFTDLNTLSPIFCVTALHLMWWMREGEIWRNEALIYARRYVVIFVLGLFLLGLISAVLRLLVFIYTILFAKLATPFNEETSLWIWLLALICSTPLLARNWNKRDVLEGYLGQVFFWGWSSLIVAIIYLALHSLSDSKSLNIIYAWGLLALESIGIMLLYLLKHRISTNTRISQKVRSKKRS